MAMSFHRCIKLVITCAVVGAFIHVSTAKPTKYSLSKSEFPNPKIDGEKSWVCDPSGLLTRKEVTDLKNQLTHLRGNNSCQGWITGVAIVDKIRLDDDTHPSGDSGTLEAMREFADQLRQKMREFRTCDNDLVIVVSMQDRKVWTSTASGVQKTLSDRSIRDLSDNTMELMHKDGCFYGLTYLVSEYTRMQTGKRVRTRRETEATAAASGTGGVGALLLLCCFYIFCCGSSKVDSE